jgi:low affinity Fe/Cu permease
VAAPTRGLAGQASFPAIADVGIRAQGLDPSPENEAAMREIFDRLTTGCARFAGRPQMLIICVLLAGAGVAAYFSGDELFISGANISISIVTLLLLPILQATQNRDGAALQAKIDELIKANAKARDDLIGLENRAEHEIEQIRLDEGQRSKPTGGTVAGT